MFGVKCPHCEAKNAKKNAFCAQCGKTLHLEKEEDFGLFGKVDTQKKGAKMPFGLETMFNILVKELDKQMVELDKELVKESKQKKTKQNVSGMSISITTMNNRPEIQITSFGKPQQKTQTVQPAVHEILSDDKLKQIVKLPKEEASTSVRRLSNKVIYEVNMPGVESIDDISIMQLENSIEIKALAKQKAYFKVIPVNFPLHRYGLRNEKLILELRANE